MSTTTRSSPHDQGKVAAEAADEALESARSVRDSAMSSAAETADAAKEAVGPVIDTVRERAQHLGARVQDIAHDTAGDAYRRGRHAVRAVNRQIGDQPLYTALAAFAIGYGVSYLLHGQR
jgi:ElaB/YqjD/DUF883 family membrane-anchored ribosome-binding protein